MTTDRVVHLNNLTPLLLLGLALGVLCSFAVLIISPKKASALPAGTTFTVTNNNASGAGSLAQAITDANSNANPGQQDIIEFDIPDSGDITITPTTQLTISQPLLINGFTQGDATQNTTLAPLPMDGILRVMINNQSSDYLNIVADDVTLQGLVISRGQNGNIRVTEANNFKLYGSYVGSEHRGLMKWNHPNQADSLIKLLGVESAEIGGNSPHMRNVIGYSYYSYIDVAESGGIDSSNITIKGNNIGVGSDSITHNIGSIDSAGPGIALRAGTHDVTIGGTAEGQGNFIQNLPHGALLIKDAYDVSFHGNLVNNNGGVSGGNDGNIRPMILLLGAQDITIGSTVGFGGNKFSYTNNSISAIGVMDSPDTENPSINVMILGNTFGLNYTADVISPISGNSILLANNTAGTVIGSNYFIGQKNKAAIYAMHDVTGVDINLNHFEDSDGGSAIEVENSVNTFDIHHNIITGIQAGDYSRSAIRMTGQTDDIAITENSIYNNDLQGIDIDGNSSVRLNDPGDSDGGSNQGLNFPDNISYEEDGGNTKMRFNLDVPAGQYRIEFFSNSNVESPYYGSGETFLGYVNVTHSGDGSQEFEHTLTGIGHSNVTTTTTEIDNSTPSGFGATSEFSDYASTYVAPPEPPQAVDIASEIKLLNPEDVALGAQLQYELTLKNYGPGAIDITPYDSSIFGSNSIFVLLLPPDVTFISSADNDLSCISGGPGSASLFGPATSNHSDYELAGCGYEGGNLILAAGESISTIMTVEVQNDSDLEFTLLNMSLLQEFDPEAEYIYSVFMSGNDAYDFFINQYPPNNFSMAVYPIIDINTIKTIVDSPTAEIGDTVNYKIEFSNDGVTPVDLAQFDASGMNPFVTALLIDVLPPGLEYTSVDDPSVSCQWVGPGSAAIANPIFGSHQDFGLLLCIYTTPTVIQPGEIISFTLTTTVTSDPGEQFTNYAIAQSLSNLNDPDYLAAWRAMGRSYAYEQYGMDFIDSTLTDAIGGNSNFSFATFLTEEENPDPDNGGGGDNNNGNTDNSGNNGNGGGIINHLGNLADTGQAAIFGIITALLLITCSITVWHLAVKNHDREL